MSNTTQFFVPAARVAIDFHSGGVEWSGAACILLCQNFYEIWKVFVWVALVSGSKIFAGRTVGTLTGKNMKNHRGEQGNYLLIPPLVTHQSLTILSNTTEH